MKRILLAIVIGILGLIPFSGSAGADRATAEIVDQNGAVIGNATLRAAPTGVLIMLEITSLTPGTHAIHLHNVGKCEPEFAAAKGHVNPHKRQHGLFNPEGPERGDLPNFFVAADRSARAEFYTTLVSLDRGTAPLLDKDGSALVIHENPDDHLTQPIGGAGARIACGIIKAQ
ncbi:MAG: superoxide dismutase family protein [Gammaproteobacteria bacterium]|nr:superoxide dismutase family protein [Gammaproteobacteria bacterium]